MAIIAMLYGIIVSMYFVDSRKHHVPLTEVLNEKETALSS